MESDNAISSNKQFEKVCRTCFSKDNLVDFCAETNDYYELSYLSMFNKYLNMKVDENDSINKICVNCLECLQIVHVFVTNSKKAERSLQTARDNNITVLRLKEDDDDNIYFDDIKNMLQFKKEQINNFVDDIEVVLNPPIIHKNIKTELNQTNIDLDKIIGDDKQSICLSNKRNRKSINGKSLELLKKEALKVEQKQKQIELQLNAYLAKRNKTLNRDERGCKSDIVEIDAKYINNTIILKNVISNKYINATKVMKVIKNVSKVGKQKNETFKTFRFKCKQCNMLFYKETELLAHGIRVHLKGCNHCNIKFYSTQLYREHFRKFHQFRCGKCHVKFELSTQLTEHQAHCTKSATPRHTNEHSRQGSDRYIVCEICGKYMKRFQIVRHLQTVHTTYPPLLCEDCGKYFLGPLRLEKHQRNMHTVFAPGERTRHECTVCNRLLKTRAGLSTHISTLHATKKMDGNCNQCMVCYKICRNPAALHRHMALHTGIRQYACEQCNATYAREGTLVLHMQRSHNPKADDSFRLKHIKASQKCKLCNIRVTSPSKLRAHMQYHHKREKRYNCPVCPKGFVYKATYDNHLQRHKGEETHE